MIIFALFISSLVAVAGIATYRAGKAEEVQMPEADMYKMIQANLIVSVRITD